MSVCASCLNKFGSAACTFVFGKFRLKILGYRSSNTKYFCLGILRLDLEISTHVLRKIGRYRIYYVSKRGDFNARNSKYLRQFYR